MESKDKSGLVGGALVAVAIIAMIGLAAFTLAGKGPGEDVKTQAPATSENHNSSGQSTSGSNMEDQQSGDVREGNASVEIDNFKFTPANITVKKGTTVKWTNKDSARHDITPDEMAEGAPKSELLGKDESYTHTFDTVGTFSYYCSPHPYMKASVTVVE